MNLIASVARMIDEADVDNEKRKEIKTDEAPGIKKSLLKKTTFL